QSEQPAPEPPVSRARPRVDPGGLLPRGRGGGPAPAPGPAGAREAARGAPGQRADHHLGPPRLTYLIYTETYPSLDPASPRQTGIGRYCHDLAAGLVSLGERAAVLTNEAIGARGTTVVDGVRVLARG